MGGHIAVRGERSDANSAMAGAVAAVEREGGGNQMTVASELTRRCTSHYTLQKSAVRWVLRNAKKSVWRKL